MHQADPRRGDRCRGLLLIGRRRGTWDDHALSALVDRIMAGVIPRARPEVRHIEGPDQTGLVEPLSEP
jgi:hypothetical protein